MKQPNRRWYLPVALLALLPAGYRGLAALSQRSASPDLLTAQAGEELFKHEWKPNDPLCAGGDGLGPVFNASSCVACHNQGGPGGAGGVAHNVTMFTVRDPGQPPREGVVHARHVKGAGSQETLKHVHPDLPAVSQPAVEQLV